MNTISINDKIQKAAKIMVQQKKEMAEFLLCAEKIVDYSNAIYQVSNRINKSVEKATFQSEIGKNSIANAIEDMENIESSAQALLDKVDNLTAISSSLTDIIHSLQNISSQTNLLALNASIEAARVGLESKGFEVVAKEIRKLSDESKNATVEAKKSVQDIIQAVSEIKEISQLGKELSKVGIQSIYNTEKQFTEINRTISLVKNDKDSLGETAKKVKSYSENAHSYSQTISKNRELIAEGLDSALSGNR